MAILACAKNLNLTLLSPWPQTSENAVFRVCVTHPNRSSFWIAETMGRKKCTAKERENVVLFRWRQQCRSEWHSFVDMRNPSIDSYEWNRKIWLNSHFFSPPLRRVTRPAYSANAYSTVVHCDTEPYKARNQIFWAHFNRTKVWWKLKKADRVSCLHSF